MPLADLVIKRHRDDVIVSCEGWMFWGWRSKGELIGGSSKVLRLLLVTEICGRWATSSAFHKEG